MPGAKIVRGRSGELDREMHRSGDFRTPNPAAVHLVDGRRDLT
jgi:hypothetical protein